jgi:prepilin-type N-terminal cleavage/methylation domain-containing protein
MKKITNKKGFTLIELLVVIAIIGILSGIVLVSLGGARSKARDAKRQSDIQQVVVAQEMYYNDNEAYYATDTANGVPAIGTYLNGFDDPQTTKHYTWLNNIANTQYFCVYAALESGSIFAASEKGTKLLPSTATPAGVTTCF